MGNVSRTRCRGAGSQQNPHAQNPRPAPRCGFVADAHAKVAKQGEDEEVLTGSTLDSSEASRPVG